MWLMLNNRLFSRKTDSYLNTQQMQVTFTCYVAVRAYGFYLGKGRVSGVLRSHYTLGRQLLIQPLKKYVQILQLLDLHSGTVFSAPLIRGEVAANSHSEQRLSSDILGHIKCKSQFTGLLWWSQLVTSWVLLQYCQVFVGLIRLSMSFLSL